MIQVHLVACLTLCVSIVGFLVFVNLYRIIFPHAVGTGDFYVGTGDFYVGTGDFCAGTGDFYVGMVDFCFLVQMIDFLRSADH